MKKILLVLGAMLALCMPSMAATETVIDQRIHSLTSIAPPPLGANQSQGNYYALDSGTYTLRILLSGYTDVYSSVVSRIFQVDFGTPTSFTHILTIGGSTGTFSQLYEQSFTVTGAVNRLFQWETFTDVTMGNVQATYQLTKQAIPVPGPEAGAGLSALALAGLGYFLVRRRRLVAA